MQTLPSSKSVFVDLGFPRFVTRVETAKGMVGVLVGNLNGCNVTSIVLSSAAQPPTNAVSCSFSSIDGVGRWACPSTNRGRQFVIVSAVETLPNCLISVFVDDTPVCGLSSHINPFAGRFFNSPVYDSPWLYQDVQPSALSSNGCTNYGQVLLSYRITLRGPFPFGRGTPPDGVCR